MNSFCDHWSIQGKIDMPFVSTNQNSVSKLVSQVSVFDPFSIAGENPFKL